MQIVIVGSIAISVFLTLMISTFVQKSRRKRTKRKEEQALKGMASGIGEQLHAVHPGSKWRWVCYPSGFAVNGGIARIDVVLPTGEKHFMDVCLSTSGYMTLHMLNVAELSTAENVPNPAGKESCIDEYVLPDTKEICYTTDNVTSTLIKPHNKETVIKWFNIVLINNLTTLIDDVNAQGSVCLFIGKDGKAFVEDDSSTSIVYDFGELPDITLWDFITEKLSMEGLFAETQENSKIFISWA